MLILVSYRHAPTNFPLGFRLSPLSALCPLFPVSELLFLPLWQPLLSPFFGSLYSSV